MNRILKLGLLSVIVGALYSCSSDSLYDPDKAGDVKLAQYEAAFVGKYGAIASNQNWGFGGTTTRSSNPNSNQWKDFVEVPSSDDLTSEKINKIVELFKDPSKAKVIDRVNWSDFFVQQVYYGDKSNMNQFAVVLNDGTLDEVNNFNMTAGTTMLMYNSGTSSFSYLGEGNNRYDEHIIIFYEGDYYVGLDFECYMNQNTPPDGDYSDWIVRIVPAKYKSPKNHGGRPYNIWWRFRFQ